MLCHYLHHKPSTGSCILVSNVYWVLYSDLLCIIKCFPTALVSLLCILFYSLEHHTKAGDSLSCTRQKHCSQLFSTLLTNRATLRDPFFPLTFVVFFINGSPLQIRTLCHYYCEVLMDSCHVFLCIS